MLTDPSWAAKLTDVTVGAFLEVLNNRLFVGTYPTRLTNLLAAYRNGIDDVLVFNTARVVEIYGEDIRPTGMDTGVTILSSATERRVIDDAGANVRGQAAE